MIKPIYNKGIMNQYPVYLLKRLPTRYVNFGLTLINIVKSTSYVSVFP